MTALSQDLLMNENQTVEMPNVTASSFENISAAAVTIQIVNLGVPIAGVTTGSSGQGNNMLAINMATLVPNSVNFKAYKVFLSGSATDLYSGWTDGNSGGSGTGAFQAQFQFVSGYQVYRNAKGNVAVTGTSIAEGGGATANYPDNVIVTPANLTGDMLYFCGTTSNGSVQTPANVATNIWLTFSPIL